jgi:DNA polymerase I-like protein with 3'-5' exonuclease and polymerase domains
MTKPRRQSRAKLFEERGQVGMFSVEEMTRVPASDWAPPDLSQLPDRLAGVIGVDTETEDLGLRADQGGGWAWDGGGRVVGYSVSADNWSGYLPIGHPEGNVDPNQARRWLNHALGDADQTKVFAHAMYDLGWAENDGVEIKGPVIDVQWVEALLDEHRLEYSLEAIARDRIGVGKDETLLHEAARAYGVDPKAELYKLPSKFVGPYATWDSQGPRRIWEVQQLLIESEKLGNVCQLEHDLLPMYMGMRRRGVRIDQNYVVKLRGELVALVDADKAELRRCAGRDVVVWASDSVAAALKDELGSWPWTTPTGEPSVTHDLLEGTGGAIAPLILSIRQREKLISTFIDGQIIDALHAGRVHGQIHPLRTDDGGTVTGRLSMSNPNLQFIPVRTEEGKKIRGAFLANDGEEFASMDFNQQEMRLLVHYACLVKMPSALAARERYISDPKMSYHEFVASVTGLDYKPAKSLNFAIVYGRGIKETAAELGLSYDETKALFLKHAEKMPFARSMSYRCQDVVNQNGYIRSMTGRRVRFPYFEPKNWDLRTKKMHTLEQAKREWPDQQLTRARSHKSLNSLVQPAAADQMKIGMREVHRAGLSKHVMIQVHDELCASVPDPKIAYQIADCMRDAVKLEVPSIVDVELGNNWMECG